MEEKKLTDEEIVNALECMAGIIQRDCDNCPFMIGKFCSDTELSTVTLDLIHRLQNKILEYEQKLEDGELVSKDWHDEQVGHAELVIAEQKAEIERLKIDLENEKNWGKIKTKQAVKDTAREFAILVEFHSVATMENGVEYFTITSLGLSEILHENFGVEYSELYPCNGVEVE